MNSPRIVITSPILAFGKQFQLFLDFPPGYRESAGLSAHTVYRAGIAALCFSVSDRFPHHLCPTCREPFIVVGASAPCVMPSIVLFGSGSLGTDSINMEEGGDEEDEEDDAHFSPLVDLPDINEPPARIPPQLRGDGTVAAVERFVFDQCFALCRRPHVHLHGSDAVVIAVSGIAQTPVISQPLPYTSHLEMPDPALSIVVQKSSVVVRVLRISPELIAIGWQTLIGISNHFQETLRQIPGFVDYQQKYDSSTGILTSFSMYDSHAKAKASHSLARRYRRSEPGFANPLGDISRFVTVLLECAPS